MGNTEEEAEEAEEEQEEALMVPQVKVAEDGSLIIDEERLVEICRPFDLYPQAGIAP